MSRSADHAAAVAGRVIGLGLSLGMSSALVRIEKESSIDELP